MPDFSKGKIYTIRSLTDPNIYVGSTIQTLCQRMANHRSDYKKNIGLGLNKNIVEDIKDWYIELYELCPCNEKCELLKKEGEIIRLIGTLNKNIAGRSKNEYTSDNKDKIKEKDKKYRNTNKEIISQKNKIYYENNKDQILEKVKKYQTNNTVKDLEWNIWKNTSTLK